METYASEYKVSAAVKKLLWAEELEAVRYLETAAKCNSKSSGADFHHVIVSDDHLHVIPVKAKKLPEPYKLVKISALEHCYEAHTGPPFKEEIRAQSMRITVCFQRDGRITPLDTVGDSMSRSRSRERNNSTSSLRSEKAVIPKEEDIVLVFHTVSKNSKLKMHIERAWHNAVLRASTPIGRGYDCSHHTQRRRREKELSVLFRQLEREVMKAKTVMKKVDCCEELAEATRHDRILRRLFWHSPNFLHFLVDEAEYFMLSPALREEMGLTGELFAHSADPEASRDDEIVYCAVLFNLLARNLFDGEAVQDRLNCLVAKSPYSMEEMIRLLLLNNTDILGTPFPTTVPLTLAMRALNEEVVSVLYETLQLVRQGAVEGEPYSHHSSQWFVRLLESISGFCGEAECPPCTCRLAFFINRLEGLFAEEKEDIDVVKIFKHVALICDLMTLSEPIRTHVRQSHAEEFQYRIGAPEHLRRLPASAPVTSHTVAFVHDILRMLDARD